MTGRKNSEAKIRANNKYNDKAYDRINLAVPKGYKATIQKAAEETKQTINAFATSAIYEKIDRMSKDREQQ